MTNHYHARSPTKMRPMFAVRPPAATVATLSSMPMPAQALLATHSRAKHRNTASVARVFFGPPPFVHRKAAGDDLLLLPSRTNGLLQRFSRETLLFR
ncbi:hypothetical protein DEO72_LG2g675 [Vigna unguiculata]|uniref:Uncharacterized protein n=1 Tax=Vigna unguiculata TaxID=3917 RepID=A0A4D6L083_VIGUN|nr:hypothetical protein DEO72_LG2g675 [Vigna unguiculata]